SRAVFLDRDGVLNELVFDKEECRISSPLSSSQIQIFPYVPVTIKKIQEMGFKAIVASNQPGVAKKQFSFSEFVRMKEKFKDRLAKEKCFLDGEYYCLHHPSAVLKKYKVKCECRKPKPGLIIRAALENKIDLKASFFVGDSLVDVKAGKAAGCKTILISHMTDFLNHIMQKENIFPDYLVSSLKEVPAILLGTSKIGGVPTLRHK
ncbi:MAG: D-glycero-alpha-D-manno-heptose-1,7-bisphosphate 7-phosphatase, partial [Nitrososphaerales archaeon]